MPYAFSHQGRARHIRTVFIAALLTLTAALTCVPLRAQPPQPVNPTPNDVSASHYRAAAYDYAWLLVQFDAGGGIERANASNVNGGSLRAHPLWTVLPSFRAGFTVGASYFDKLNWLVGARLSYRTLPGFSFGADILRSTSSETLVSLDAAYDMGWLIGVRGTSSVESSAWRAEVFGGLTIPFISAPD